MKNAIRIIFLFLALSSKIYANKDTLTVSISVNGLGYKYYNDPNKKNSEQVDEKEEQEKQRRADQGKGDSNFMGLNF
jgi:hypothetical protein